MDSEESKLDSDDVEENSELSLINPSQNNETDIRVYFFVLAYVIILIILSLIFESSIFENIWGGDIWSLQEADSNDSLTPFDDSSWNPQTIAVTISFIGIIILLIFLAYKRRQ